MPQNLHTNNSVHHKNSSSAFVGKFGGIVSFDNGNIKTGKGQKRDQDNFWAEEKGKYRIFEPFFSLLYKLGIYSSGCCWVNRGDAKIVACLSGCRSTSCATDLHFLLNSFPARSPHSLGRLPEKSSRRKKHAPEGSKFQAVERQNKLKTIGF